MSSAPIPGERTPSTDELERTVALRRIQPISYDSARGDLAFALDAHTEALDAAIVRAPNRGRQQVRRQARPHNRAPVWLVQDIR